MNPGKSGQDVNLTLVPAEIPSRLKIGLRNVFCQVSNVSFLDRTERTLKILGSIINFVVALGLLNGKPSKASPR